jgi:outer membrane protein W
LLLAGFLISPLVNTFGQYNQDNHSIAVYYNYTTTSKLFLYPDVTDPVLRNTGVRLNDVTNFSIEYRYRISEALMLSFATEYMQRTKNVNYLTVSGPSGVATIEMEDGYEFIPFEFSLYYLIPFSTEKFKFYFGGGIAYYLGSHVRNFADVDIETASRDFSYGIQTGVGMDYLIFPYLAVRGQMKFRDPEFEIVSKYNKLRFTYQGKEYRLASEKFDSKVNIDGVTFMIGVSYSF